MSVDCLLVISCAGLHALVFLWIARVVRALRADIAVISLNSLTGLEEVTEHLNENNNVSEASSWVGDPVSILGPPL